MKFPVIELVDRYCIAVVKFEKTHGANNEELRFYEAQIAHLDRAIIQKHLDALYEIHYRIWNMEDDFKKCRIDNAPLEEIGRRALEIRDLNNHRVETKNKIAELVGDSVREIKQYNA